MKQAMLNRPTEPTTGSVGTELPVVAQDANRSIRQASAIAGVGLLLMSVLSAFGYLVAVKGLVVPGNAAATADKVADHQGLFRLGILSLYLVAALDAIVAWALYRVFKPVSGALSKLAAWLRVAYAGTFVVAISQLVGVLGVHTRALRQINTFTNIWDAGLVLFGLNLFVLAYLAYRSRYVPRLLGVLLATAGFGYVFDSGVRGLARGSSSDVSAITGIGEFVFALWLVTRGRRITLGSHDDSIGAAISAKNGETQTLRSMNGSSSRPSPPTPTP
jgi:hypothetical protein